MAADPQIQMTATEVRVDGNEEQVGSLKRKKEKAPRLDLKVCRFTEGCNEFIGMGATMCPACGGGIQNARGKTSKDCPDCGEAAAQQAHVCKNCGHKYAINYSGNFCPVCERGNVAQARYCQFCKNENGEKVELRGKRENKKPGLLYPRTKAPFQPSASRPGTVIRALPEAHVYSVRRYDTGPGFRCACLFDPGNVEEGKPPRQICNRLECLQLAQFSKGVGEAESEIGGPLVGLCEHLQLVKEALDVESSGGASVEGPLRALTLQDSALDKLTAQQKVSTDRAKALRKLARELTSGLKETGSSAWGLASGTDASLQNQQVSTNGLLESGQGGAGGTAGGTNGTDGPSPRAVSGREGVPSFEWGRQNGMDAAFGGLEEGDPGSKKRTASIGPGQAGGTNGTGELERVPTSGTDGIPPFQWGQQNGTDAAFGGLEEGGPGSVGPGHAGGTNGTGDLERVPTSGTDGIPPFEWGQQNGTDAASGGLTEGGSGSKKRTASVGLGQAVDAASGVDRMDHPGSERGPRSEPDTQVGACGVVVQVTNSFLLVPVEGRTSANGFGHIEFHQDDGTLSCHVAKGKACSEYTKREGKGSKHCNHTLLALWALEGGATRILVESSPEELSGGAGGANIETNNGCPIPAEETPLAPAPSKNEFSLLARPQKLQILFLLAAVSMPPEIPAHVLQKLESFHLCNKQGGIPGACPSDCPFAWPVVFSSKRETCFWGCQTKLQEISFKNVTLLDSTAILFDREVTVKKCPVCGGAFPPTDWEESGCGILFANQLLLTMRAIRWIRLQDTPGLAPTSSIECLLRSLRHQIPVEKRAPKIFNIEQAYWGNEALTNHGYSFECGLHGASPPSKGFDGNENQRCDLPEPIRMDTTREQIIDVDQYWNQVDISVSSALVLGKRVNTLDKRTVERIGGLAPWQAPRDRAATGRYFVRSPREDRMPKGDPRAGNYDAFLKQMATDNLHWDALAAQRKEKLKQMHRVAYGTAGEGKKAAYLARFSALREHWEAYRREAAAKGTTACLKGFPDFDDTTANIFKGLCPDGVTCFLSIGLDAESPQDPKDALLNSRSLPDLGFYDFMCKTMEGARREFPVAFPTGGRIPCSSDGQPLPLPHLDHISPAFGKSRPNRNPQPALLNPLDAVTSGQTGSADEVPPETVEAALKMARGATRDRQTTGFAELLVVEALYPAAADSNWRLTAPALFKPPGSSRSVLEHGPLLADGSRRPHPYTGNTQETLGLTSSSHIANHVGPCKQERDPAQLREQLAGTNLEGPEQVWSQDTRHLGSHTGMNLAMFSFALRFRTHKSNESRNEQIRENLLRAANRGSARSCRRFDVAQDQFGRFTVVRKAAGREVNHAELGESGGEPAGGCATPPSRQGAKGGSEHWERPTVDVWHPEMTSPGVESSPHQIGRRRRFGRSPFSPVGGGAESAWWRAARP